MEDQHKAKEKYDPVKLTWAVLIAQWIEFAQSAVALPDDLEGRAMKDSVPDIITLQAVYMALKEIDALEYEEQALGLDKAGLMIREARERLTVRYEAMEMPGLLLELMNDCEEILNAERERLKAWRHGLQSE